MRFQRTALALAIVLLVWVLAPLRTAAQYVMIVGYANTGTYDVMNVDWGGTLTLRSSFDTWQDTQYLGDPWDMVVSKKGGYVFFYDFMFYNGAVYSIDNNYQFHFMHEMIGTCPGCTFYGGGGGGFTTDEKYLFTTSYRAVPPLAVVLNTWRLNGQNCDLVTTQSVPTTNPLTANILSNSYDEVLASSLNGNVNSHNGFVVYQFDRVRERLDLKQYIPDVPCLYTAMGPQGDFVAYSWGTVGTIVRGTDSTYTLQSSYMNPAWGGGHGICVTPDGSIAVSVMSHNSKPSGLALFSITPARDLVFRQFAQKPYCDALAMSPDGRLVVVAHHGTIGNDHNLTVYRINPSPPSLEELSTLHVNSWAFCMKFLPQALATPPAKAEPIWPLYSSKTEPKPPPADVDEGDSRGAAAPATTPAIHLASRAQ